MIRNDEELEVVRQQLGRAEAAFLSLEKSMLPKNRAKFNLMSEGYLQMIVRLRSEVDAYLGLESAYAVRPYLVIALEGNGITFGEAPLSVVAGTLARLRLAFDLLWESTAENNDFDAPSRAANGRVCDPPLLGIAPSGLRILLGEPCLEDQEATAFRRTTELLIQGVEMAGGSTEPSRNGGSCADKRRAIYEALLYVSPTLEGEIETVRIGGRAVGDRQLPPLTKASTCWLKEEVHRLDQGAAEQSPAPQAH
ncbi:MAG TPA: hypothetical protein VNH11_35430 [Pirellulales bacterium]|nr:hypothetical protein [Pirellulales bacterium]